MTHKRRGFTMIELLVVFGLGGIFSAMLLPAVQGSREAARNVQCKDNLHNVALAMHNYHDVYGRLPCGWYQHSWEADEPDAFGWGTSILPYIDQAPLFIQIVMQGRQRPSELDAQMLRALRELRIDVYRCPSDPSPDVNSFRGDWSAMNYSANFGHLPPPRWEAGTLASLWPGMAMTPEQCGGLFCCNWGAGFRDVVDGLSNTIMIGERGAASTNGLWMGVRGNILENDAVTDASRFSPLNGGIGTFGSVHEGGAHILLSDGAVRFIFDEVNMPPEERAGTFGLNGQPHTHCLMEILSCRRDGMPVDAF